MLCMLLYDEVYCTQYTRTRTTPRPMSAFRSCSWLHFFVDAAAAASTAPNVACNVVFARYKILRILDSLFKESQSTIITFKFKRLKSQSLNIFLELFFLSFTNSHRTIFYKILFDDDFNVFLLNLRKFPKIYSIFCFQIIFDRLQFNFYFIYIFCFQNSVGIFFLSSQNMNCLVCGYEYYENCSSIKNITTNVINDGDYCMVRSKLKRNAHVLNGICPLMCYSLLYCRRCRMATFILVYIYPNDILFGYACMHQITTTHMHTTYCLCVHSNHIYV